VICEGEFGGQEGHGGDVATRWGEKSHRPPTPTVRCASGGAVGQTEGAPARDWGGACGDRWGGWAGGIGGQRPAWAWLRHVGVRTRAWGQEGGAVREVARVAGSDASPAEVEEGTRGLGTRNESSRVGIGPAGGGGGWAWSRG